ncbi:MAG: ABC transporter permease [Chloroflexi bacterium]|nr:ABC transporter permease [Chloroflexota bacterium]
MAHELASSEQPLARRLAERVRYYAPTIITAVAVLLAWELIVRVFNIQQFLVPKPSSIVAAFVDQRGILAGKVFNTLRSAVGGFVLGSIAGILVALITARWAILSQAMMPFAIAANSVPIVAFSPILFNWFGPSNPFSWMAIVAVIVFFPVMINMVRGLTQVDPRALELMRSYAASDFKTLFALRIPNALPFLFSALRVATVLSMIGAVVADFFGVERATIGKYITQESASFKFENTWAAILLVSVIGIVFYLIVALAERAIMPWHVSVRKSE